MRKATLIRDPKRSGDQGTFGEIVTDTGFRCVSLELPWRGNERKKSCVPAGVYLFHMVDSPKHGRCYEEWDDPATPQIEDVPGRDRIQIHAANLAGDVDRGYISQLLGCIAPGMTIVTFRAGSPPAGDKDQLGVSASKFATAQLVENMGQETFELTIKWAPKEA